MLKKAQISEEAVGTECMKHTNRDKTQVVDDDHLPVLALKPHDLNVSILLVFRMVYIVDNHVHLLVVPKS